MALEGDRDTWIGTCSEGGADWRPPVGRSVIRLLRVAAFNEGGAATFADVLLADNVGSDNCSLGSATVTSNDYNVSTDDSCGLAQAHDQEGVASMLGGTMGALAYNGGALPGMYTHALSGDNPAIDIGSNVCPSPVNVDERGATRPDGDACDAGAYETTKATPESTTTTTAPAVAGENAQAPSTTAAPVVAGQVASAGGSLPRTGGSFGGPLAVGLALLVLGFGLSLASRARRTRPVLNQR